jgi:hypothetical protein
MATKSAPFSMRLSKRMETLIDREAKRTGRSKGAIVEALADEALRMRLFPGIGFMGRDWDRRAWVMGTGLDVWQVVDIYKDVGSVERMVEDCPSTSGRPSLRWTTTRCSPRRSTP